MYTLDTDQFKFSELILKRVTFLREQNQCNKNDIRATDAGRFWLEILRGNVYENNSISVFIKGLKIHSSKAEK